VVLRGEVDISVADIDLMRLDLGVMLAAVETEVRRERSRTASLAGTLGPPALSRWGRKRRCVGSPSRWLLVPLSLALMDML
jgi:hypothetical protein